MMRFAAAAAIFLFATAASTTAPQATPIIDPGARIALGGAPMQGGLVSGMAPAGTAELRLDGVPVRLAADGRFLLGFDRDHGASAILEAKLADGRILALPIAISPRRWAVERINLPQRPSAATEQYLRLRARELARIEAARALDLPAEGWRQQFIWPARGRISGSFGSQRIYQGVPAAFHSGVDIAAGAGAPVVAPADGVVVLAGPPAFSLEGNLVIIDHGMGLNSAFLHLAATHVREGQTIRQGQAIGIVGKSGRATGPHLHWSVKWNSARLDPARLAGPRAGHTVRP